MITELGKALDPVADKLTLCILFACLMFKNHYARAIALVMLVKELYMLVMQIIVKKKCGRTSGGAKWYGKICTASLFFALGAYLVFPNMPGMLSNVIMLLVVFIMLYTMIMYAYLFKSMLGKSSIHKHLPVKVFIYTLLLLMLYLIIGAVVPFLNHPRISPEYDTAFQLSDYRGQGTDRVRLISTNEAALTERIRLIDMAKDSIILSTFDFRADESGKDVIAALCNAADRGVDVKILVDGFSGILRMDGKKAFYELASKPAVQMKIYNPVNILEPWNLMARLHDKYLIVDDYGYLLGGCNTYDLFLGSYTSAYKNLDLDVFVWNVAENEASSITQIKDYFEKLWALPYCEPYKYPSFFAESKASDSTAAMLNTQLEKLHAEQIEALHTTDSLDNTLPAGRIQLISNPIHRQNKEPYVWSTLYHLMDSAKERVYLHSPYVICSDDMYAGLTAIGHKDIETRLLLNAPENGANPFGCSDYLSEKANVLATGFSVYEYMGEYSYHAKALLIDRNLSIIGSYNTDMRSTYLDTELMLSIESEELNDALEQVMNTVEGQSRQAISGKEYILPDTVPNATFNTWGRIKSAIVVFLTRPIRFLL